MDTVASSTILNRRGQRSQRLSYAHDLSEKSVTFADETYWLEANKYQIWKNAPKLKNNSTNIELFSISIR